VAWLGLSVAALAVPAARATAPPASSPDATVAAAIRRAFLLMFLMMVNPLRY
jgi:hypothetical protein